MFDVVNASRKGADPSLHWRASQAKESPAISCVQQTAIRLSRGSDTANIIANAAVSACDGEAIKEASEVSGKDGRPEKVLADIRYTMMRSALVAINNGAEGTML